ncbi:GcrA family cell cycle regulator [Hyphomicrobium sp. NDB2Meth4]|uniref:GcrA family cell cycle regulator n=1 Tax=Hyphomicrobium sp. NDB2Meth4 TaxID=1892846 RepID=UPI000A9AAC74
MTSRDEPDLAAKETTIDQHTKKTSKRRTLATLLNNECRWPIGDPQQPDFHFCGEHKNDGQSYCPTHAALASSSARPRGVTNKRGD